MTREEVTRDADLYKYLSTIDSAALQAVGALAEVEKYSFTDPNPCHLTQGQLDRELDVIRDAMEANFRGVALQNLHADYPEFTPAPSMEELDALKSAGRAEEDKARLGIAEALTDSRRAPALTALHKAMEAVQSK